MELPSIIPIPNPQKTKKKSTPKKSLIFPEMDLSSLNIKKNSYIFSKKAFLIFMKTEPCTFQHKFEK